MQSDLFDPSAPEALVADARAFITKVAWTTAKTDPEPHHQYCMVFSARKQGMMPEYFRLVSLILNYGFDRCWRRRVFRSLDLDGHSYWLMDLSTPGEYARDIVNRQVVEHGGWNRNQPLAPDWA